MTGAEPRIAEWLVSHDLRVASRAAEHPERHRRARTAALDLATLYEERGEPARAAPWRERAGVVTR
jgi:hypothetical protein